MAASRLRADDVKAWAQRELTGYADVDEDDLPLYRRSKESVAEFHWTGYAGSSATSLISPSDARPEFRDLFLVEVKQSISELESLAAEEDGALGIPWPAGVIGRWNQLADANQAVHIEGMSLFSARTKAPKQLLVHVLDSVRTQVLNFALDLERAAGDTSGEVGGPTVEDPSVEAAVTNFITNVYGPGATITQANVVRDITVNVDDVDGLTRAAESLGLRAADVQAYVEAVEAARDDPERSRLSAFLERVKSGGLSLAGGVASNVAAAQLMSFAQAYLGS